MAVTNSDLIQKLAEKNKEIAMLTTQFAQEKAELKKEIIQLLKIKILTTTDDQYKVALRLYANGFSVGNIHRMLNTEYGIDMTLSDVRLLVDKVDFLNPELRRYYEEQKKEFASKVKVDKGIFASTIFKKFQLLENTVTEQLERARDIEDEKQIMFCVAELKNIYKEMSNVFFKGGMDSGIDSAIMDSIDSYDRQINEVKTNIIKFGEMKVI